MPKNWSTLSGDKRPLAHLYRYLSHLNNYLGLGVLLGSLAYLGVLGGRQISRKRMLRASL